MVGGRELVDFIGCTFPEKRSEIGTSSDITVIKFTLSKL